MVGHKPLWRGVYPGLEYGWSESAGERKGHQWCQQGRRKVSRIVPIWSVLVREKKYKKISPISAALSGESSYRFLPPWHMPQSNIFHLRPRGFQTAAFVLSLGASEIVPQYLKSRVLVFCSLPASSELTPIDFQS